jgi:hypothetical protein
MHASGLAARSALVLALAAGCGRLGFDPLASGGDDGGPGDDGSPPGDGPRDLDAGLPATCEASDLAYVVTTDVDESDDGESPEPPHLGSGLSLREAIALSNGRAGRECIQFERPMTITIAAAELPGVADPDGVEIDGGGAVHVTGGPTAPQLPVGIDLVTGASAVRGLRLSNFEVGIQAQSTGNTIGPGNHVHSCAVGVRIAAGPNSVRGLRSHDNGEHGIQIPPLVADVSVVQVILHHNGATGIQANASSNLAVRHATIALNQLGISAADDASGLIVENSILYRNTGAGIVVANPNDVDSVDYDDFIDDTCTSCSIGANSITADPLFIAVDDNDYRLGDGSPAIDAGTETGLDVNGDQPADYNGLGPDLGALESG